MTCEQLKASLQQLPLSELEVHVRDAWPRFIATVASPDFAGENEAVRQDRIWRHLLNQLSDAALAQIEFVFTFTPQELAALDRGERPAM